MNNKRKLKEYMSRLDTQQFKLLYSIIVHYWVKTKAFISEQNFLNLWCELNFICSEVDERFPDPYYDRELIKSYCQAHPYYFIDILDLSLIINLFCEHLDDRLDVLIQVLEKLDTEGLWAAYAYSNKALGLNENIDELVSGTEKWMYDCGGFCQKK
jgi:hypothetical protein